MRIPRRNAMDCFSRVRMIRPPPRAIATQDKLRLELEGIRQRELESAATELGASVPARPAPSNRRPAAMRVATS
jgi:hypothetical protein